MNPLFPLTELLYKLRTTEMFLVADEMIMHCFTHQK